jgi:diguanylate cyclase (GGDEF)-like protein
MMTDGTDAVTDRQPIQIFGLAILFTMVAGTLHNLSLDPGSTTATLHPMTALGYGVFAAKLVTKATARPRRALWFAFSLFIVLVSGQRLMEVFVPGWPPLLSRSGIPDLLLHMGFHGGFTVESAYALATLHLSLIGERVDRRTALVFLAAAWAGATMNVLSMLFNVVFWAGDLSVFSVSCMLFCCSAQTFRLRDMPFVRPIFARTTYGFFTRILILGTIFVPWMAGYVYFRVAPSFSNSVHLLELVFSFIGWIMLALVLIIGHLMEASRRALEKAAESDALTGAMNRRGLRQAVRGQSGSMGVILFDLDHFKAVNDTLGHDEGDRVLRETVDRVATGLRQNDIFARWGGEEFLVVADSPDEGHLAQFADRLRLLIAEQPPVMSDFGAIPITASFGVSMIGPSETNIDRAVKRADQALYIAKRQGRNRVKRASDLNLLPPAGDAIFEAAPAAMSSIR